MYANGLAFDFMGVAALRGATSLACPGPFSVFGLGASLTSAMAFSFHSEVPQSDPVTCSA
jgi:hypothetical protein